MIFVVGIFVAIILAAVGIAIGRDVRHGQRAREAERLWLEDIYGDHRR